MARAKGKITAGTETMMRAAQGEKTAILVVGGVEHTVRYRPLSYMEKTDCLSRATEYLEGPNGVPVMKFHLDLYQEECLLRMLLDAPFPITPNVLKELSIEVGEAVAALVPNPYSAPTLELKKE